MDPFKPAVFPSFSISNIHLGIFGILSIAHIQSLSISNLSSNPFNRAVFLLRRSITSFSADVKLTFLIVPISESCVDASSHAFQSNVKLTLSNQSTLPVVRSFSLTRFVLSFVQSPTELHHRLHNDIISWTHHIYCVHIARSVAEEE